MSAEIIRNNFDKIEKDNVKIPKKLFELAVKTLLENESFRNAASEAFVRNHSTVEFVQDAFTYKVEMGGALTSDHTVDQINIRKRLNGISFEAIYIEINYENSERKHPRYSYFGFHRLDRNGTIFMTDHNPSKVRRFLREINSKPSKNS